jgi:hypothetical protein
MKESFWGIFVVMLGIASIIVIVLFQNITNTDEHNSQLLKEVTEAAMWDSFDYASYRTNGEIRIYREKFVENFVRRYAESASRSREYIITFYDINEIPPKVSVSVQSGVVGVAGSTQVTFDLTNKIDAILETPY